MTGVVGGQPVVRSGWCPESGVFAHVHVPPSGTAVAAAVLVAPLMAEQSWGHPTLFGIAQSLAGRGVLTVRFDHPGTGHSAGDAERAWPPQLFASGIHEAQRLLTTAARGPLPTTLVGLRLGATAVSHLLATDASIEADQVVLVAPVPSGRHHVRAQRALASLRGHRPGDADDGSMALPGIRLPADGVREVQALRLGPPQRPPRRAMVVVPEATATAELAGTVDGAEVLVDPDLLGHLERGEQAATTVERVAAWVAAGGSAPSPVEVGDAGLSTTLELGEVVETLHALGPTGLFAIETSPAKGGDLDALAADRPVAVFLDVAAEPCVGPGRMWVTAARALGAAGGRALRYNSSGLGDSPSRPGRPRNHVYSMDAVTDALEVVDAVRAELGAGVVLVGQCSGAYNALEAAAATRVDGVCAINPVLDGPHLDGDAGRAVGTTRPRWQRRVADSRVGLAMRARLPERGWEVLDRLGAVRSPAHGLEPLVASGTDVLLVCGDDDRRRFTTRGWWVTSRLVQSGHLAFQYVPGADHGLLIGSSNRAVAELVAGFVGRLCAPLDPGA